VERLEKLFKQLRSGQITQRDLMKEVAAYWPDSPIASDLAAVIALNDFDEGSKSLEEAEAIVHEEADRHPAAASLFVFCAVTAALAENAVDRDGYLDLALAKHDRYGVEDSLQSMFEGHEAMLDMLAAFEAQEDGFEFWDIMDAGSEHLTDHYLVQEVAYADELLGPEELDVFLNQKQRTIPLLYNLCRDLMQETVISDPAEDFVVPFRIFGCLREIESLDLLIDSLGFCLGESLHEAVIALIKLGSHRPKLVNRALRELLASSDDPEAMLSAIEVLGFLHDTPGNLEFLTERLRSLDLREGAELETFVFLASALAGSGNPVARALVAKKLKQETDLKEAIPVQVQEDILHPSMPLARNAFRAGILEEDIHDICCGFSAPRDWEWRKTLTLSREMAIQAIDDGFEEPRPEEWLKTGRNEPCPCGSGKKFKKCCLPELEQGQRRLSLVREGQEPEPTSDFTNLCDKLMEFSQRPPIDTEVWLAQGEFDSCAAGLGRGTPETRGAELLEEEIFYDWFFFGRPLESSGKTVVREFAQSQGKKLSPSMGRVLDAMLASRFSIYEVEEVIPEQGLRMRDVFRGDVLEVREREATMSLVRWDLIGVRIGCFEDHNELFSHAFTIPRMFWEQVEKYAKRKCSELKRTGAVSSLPDWLEQKSYLLFHYTLRLIERQPAPVVVTAEGDLFCPCSAVFTVRDSAKVVDVFEGQGYIGELTEAGTGRRRPGSRKFAWYMSPEMERDLRAGEHIGDSSMFPPVEVGTEGMLSFDQVSVEASPDGMELGPRVRQFGTLKLKGDMLTLEGFSRERLEKGKAELKKIMGDLLVHRADAIQDQNAILEEAFMKGKRGEPLPSRSSTSSIPDEQLRALQEKLNQRYAEEWLDGPVPALGGKTPRQAARTKSGRKKVDALLKDFENSAARAGGDKPALDFEAMRRELGVWPDEE